MVNCLCNSYFWHWVPRFQLLSRQGLLAVSHLCLVPVSCLGSEMLNTHISLQWSNELSNKETRVQNVSKTFCRRDQSRSWSSSNVISPKAHDRSGLWPDNNHDDLNLDVRSHLLNFKQLLLCYWWYVIIWQLIYVVKKFLLKIKCTFPTRCMMIN